MATAEDAVQDTLLRAFVHMRDFDGRSSFGTWLTRIAPFDVGTSENDTVPKRHKYTALTVAPRSYNHGSS